MRKKDSSEIIWPKKLSKIGEYLKKGKHLLEMEIDDRMMMLILK